MSVDAPLCKEKEPRILRGRKDQATVFSCQVEANPALDIQFWWTFNNSEHSVELLEVSSSYLVYIKICLAGPGQCGYWVVAQ